jgi:hypothetical protein
MTSVSTVDDLATESLWIQASSPRIDTSARQQDRTGHSWAYAKNALAKLPPERHSLSLRLLMQEIERTPAATNGRQ